MQLISLSTNNQLFDEIYFKEGLNIVQLSSSKYDSNSFKPLLLKLIHFCYGDRNIKFSQEKELKVTLKISHNNEMFTILRNNKNIQIVNLNGIDYRLRQYKEKLGELFFDLSSETKFISFRSLISFFIRHSHSDSFNPFNFKFITNSQILINNLFLLGLDYNLEIEINELKKIYKENSVILKIKKDKNKQDSFDKKNLTDQITKIEENLQNYDISNYYSIKEKSDVYGSEIETKQNELITLIKRFNFVKSRIKIKIGEIKIRESYNDIRLSLNDHNFKSPEQIIKFSKQICINRKKYLNEELQKIEKNISTLGSEIEKCKNEQNKLLKHLGASDTFSIFLKQAEYLSFLKERRNKLQENEEVVEKNQSIKAKIRDLENQRREIYNLTAIKGINKIYANLFEHFFPNHNDLILLSKGKLKYNNDGNTSITYNHLRTFCYELTMLFSKSNHQINCLVKRDPIFDNLPPEIIEKIIQVLIDKLTTSKKQYILILELDDNSLEKIKLSKPSINWI